MVLRYPNTTYVIQVSDYFLLSDKLCRFKQRPPDQKFRISTVRNQRENEINQMHCAKYVPSSGSDSHPLQLTHTHRSDSQHGYHFQHFLLSKGMKLDKISAQNNSNCSRRIRFSLVNVPAGFVEKVPIDH
jgi:hypothetical protein